MRMTAAFCLLLFVMIIMVMSGCDEEEARRRAGKLPDPAPAIQQANAGMVSSSTSIRNSAQNQLSQVALIHAQNPSKAISVPTTIIGTEADAIIRRANEMISTLSAQLTAAEGDATALRTGLNEQINAYIALEKVNEELVEQATKQGQQLRNILVWVGGICLTMAIAGCIGFGLFTFKSMKPAAYIAGAVAGSGFLGFAICIVLHTYYGLIAKVMLGLVLLIVSAAIAAAVTLVVMLLRRQKGVTENINLITGIKKLISGMPAKYTQFIAKNMAVVFKLDPNAAVMNDEVLQRTDRVIKSMARDILSKIFNTPEDGGRAGLAYQMQSESTSHLVNDIRIQQQEHKVGEGTKLISLSEPEIIA